MPYRETPRKVKGGWALVRTDGTLHKSSGGKVVKFGSRAKALRAKGYIEGTEGIHNKVAAATRNVRKRT